MGETAVMILCLSPMFVGIPGLIIYYILDNIGIFEKISNKRDKKKELKAKDEELQERFPSTSFDFKNLVLELESLKDNYYYHGSDKKNNMGKKIDTLLSNMKIFFRKMTEQGNHSQTLTKETQYSQALKNLNELLGEDYFVDLCQNPQRWNSPEKKKQRVADALDNFNEQVLKDLKELNSDKEISFESKLGFFNVVKTEEEKKENLNVDNFFENSKPAGGNQAEEKAAEANQRRGLKSLLFKKNVETIESTASETRSYDPRGEKLFDMFKN